MPRISEIIESIEAVAPLSLQEEWDNSGLQVGANGNDCTGVMVCVDITDEVINAAIDAGCNLVVSHHPLIFRALKSIPSDSLVFRAITAGITIYSAHTSLDNATCGISRSMAEKLGLNDVRVLTPLPDRPDCGTGVVGTLPAPMSKGQFVEALKEAFGLTHIRCSSGGASEKLISRVALVGGSGGSFVNDAIKSGAQAIVTGDIRHHDFVDHNHEIFMADITHFDSEKCAKEILIRIISEKFPNFAALKNGPDCNPINYL